MADKQLEGITSNISNDFNVTYSFAFGNVKSEIIKCIEKSKPDVIVLGKRKTKSLGLIGDKITRFVLKKYNGVVFIAPESNVLKTDTDLSIGVLNSFKKSVDLVNSLVESSTKPIKVFKMIDKATFDEAGNESTSNNETVDYVFEKKGDTFKKLPDYLNKSNIDLFLINRSNVDNGTRLKRKEIEFMINKFDVPLLITG